MTDDQYEAERAAGALEERARCAKIFFSAPAAARPAAVRLLAGLPVEIPTAAILPFPIAGGAQADPDDE
ncbi:hypothetical protein [Paracoccus sanguinis]|uniref:hypothetical protein n=1 Tax=Paracoccus sanguinis TaxID=1545044 RepID=UPI00051FEBD9|nr:hypothetical protein [Paracoccus sanguinis]KGJ15130.1 hypothetical protein IX54_03390 [Paracoccus sanguinis]